MCSTMVGGGWWLAAVGSWQLATGGWWRLVVVGGGWWLVIGGWWRLAVVGSWRLVAAGGWWLAAVGGSWRLAVGGPLGRSLRAVLSKKKKSGPLRTAHPPVLQPILPRLPQSRPGIPHHCYQANPRLPPFTQPNPSPTHGVIHMHPPHHCDTMGPNKRGIAIAVRGAVSLAQCVAWESTRAALVGFVSTGTPSCQPVPPHLSLSSPITQAMVFLSSGGLWHDAVAGLSVCSWQRQLADRLRCPSLPFP